MSDSKAERLPLGDKRASSNIAIDDNDVLRALIGNRKTRATVACLPCRMRKVKCDCQHPCETCVRRGHADICSYGRQVSRSMSRKRQRTALQDDKLEAAFEEVESMQRSIGRIRDKLDELGSTPATPDAHEHRFQAADDAPGETYVGRSSLPAFVLGNSSRKDDALPIFQLQNAAVDWPMSVPAFMGPRLWGELYDAIPPNAEIIRSPWPPRYPSCLVLTLWLDASDSIATRHTLSTLSSSISPPLNPSCAPFSNAAPSPTLSSGDLG
jgi:Fungal Zn(2)-Cys(6) binuclear cluster domain